MTFDYGFFTKEQAASEVSKLVFQFGFQKPYYEQNVSF